MKKIITASLITLIIILLLPAVFAEKEDKRMQRADIAKDKAADIIIRPYVEKKQESQKEISELREKLKEAKDEEVRSELKEAIKERQKITETQVKELRERVKERSVEKEKIKQFSEETRKQYKTIKEKANETKERLKDVREKSKECKDKASEECKKLSEKVKENANDFLLRTSEQIIGLLSKAKENVERSPLDQEQKQEALARLDSRIEEVAKLKETLATDENVTKKEVKEASRLMREEWQKAKQDVRSAVGLVAASKIGGVLKRSEKLEEKLNKIVERAKETGENTQTIESLLKEFKVYVEKAKALHKEAQELFIKEKTSETMQEATEKLKLAQEELKNAQEVLKKITLELRKKQGDKK
ncbi:hypothetical protein HYV79_00115 [Candidatus Woesearchaeota archaeon]|nr:hypothetical protein [Candidatus Woesearchaeota archaeon]